MSFNVFEAGYLELAPISDAGFQSLSKYKQKKILGIQGDVNWKNEHRDILKWFPDEGKLRRELYGKHVEFFEKGGEFKERLFMAANRTGKSLTASYEIACHLTGMYPSWWTGYRFDRPVRVWASSKTSTMTRDFVQRYLVGSWDKLGTGMIPGECLGDLRESVTAKRGIPEAVDIVRVEGLFGTSELQFKSYDQGWESYQGTAQDVIWNDEECGLAVHNECLTRLMTSEGLYILTFTPLQGITEVVKSYLGESVRVDNKDAKHSYVVHCTWDDVPHLSAAEKERQWDRTPVYLRDAKARGLPSLGSGAIYPITEDRISVEPFEIPEYWPRAYALDVGWNNTAALWGAWDRQSDTVYIYSEYKQGQAEPATHVDAIKSRGKWIPGVIDPASRGRSQNDGTVLLDEYVEMGLDLDLANNAVEAGLHTVYRRMVSNRLKVFSNLVGFWGEFRLYRRNEHGKIVKENDHYMDDLRYLILSGMERAMTELMATDIIEETPMNHSNATTGY